MSWPNLARPQTREEWRLHWDAIGFAWQEDAPLRERQDAAAYKRDKFRCGGCGAFATRLVADIDPVTGEPERDEEGNIYESVPLCNSCSLDSATPLECDWSDEHKAARVPDEDWGPRLPPAPPPTSAPTTEDRAFAFTVNRKWWLRGQGDRHWFSDHAGRMCVATYYLTTRARLQPNKSLPTKTTAQLKKAFLACPPLHALSELNDRTDIEDSVREPLLVAGFAEIGVKLTFSDGEVSSG